MAIPDVLPIRRDAGYRTDTIGQHAAGQFFASVTDAFRMSLKNRPDGDEPMRWYSLLHRFDREGNHMRSDIYFAGTTADGQRETFDGQKSTYPSSWTSCRAARTATSGFVSSVWTSMGWCSA